jgi:uncharacterized protein YcgI (DUF1989 family)
MREFTIPARSGRHLWQAAGNRLKVVDVEERQVVDFFAVSAHRPEECFSPGITLDCNHSLKPTAGDVLYSSLYRPMFRIVADSVGEHDLLYPCCRPEMYEHFYGGGAGHPSCYDNITTRPAALGLPVPPAVLGSMVPVFRLLAGWTAAAGIQGVRSRRASCCRTIRF